MPSKYDPETRAKAVRLVQDHRGDYPSEWAAIRAVSSRLGMNAETLRNWIRQQQVDDGQRNGVSSEAAAEIRALKRRNAELEQTIEILVATTSFFAFTMRTGLCPCCGRCLGESGCRSWDVGMSVVVVGDCPRVRLSSAACRPRSAPTPDMLPIWRGIRVPSLRRPGPDPRAMGPSPSAR